MIGDSGLLSLLTALAPTVVGSLASSLTDELRKAALELRTKVPSAPPVREQVAGLVQAYEAQELVLVLGAGVSVPYRLPDWNTLLQTLLIGATTGGKPENQLIARLFNEVFRPSPLVAARYVRNHFKHPEAAGSFEENVRSALYAGADITDKRSPLMREICALILAPARSPMLDSVITYNFDDILERELRTLSDKIGTQIPFRTICAATERPTDRELPIYHVHGFLPSTGPLTNVNNIVLGEADYHQQYARIYSWENTVQINKFAEAHCLFVGTSFSDPNLRRLLDIAREQHQDKGIRHWIVKKKPSVSETLGLLRRKLDENPDLIDEKVRAQLTVEQVAADLIELETKFEEADSLSFGVGTIWVNEYDRVPDVLKAVRLRNPSLLEDTETLPAGTQPSSPATVVTS